MHDKINIHPARRSIDITDGIDALFDGVFAMGPDRHAVISKCWPFWGHLPARWDQKTDMDAVGVISRNIRPMQPDPAHMGRKIGQFSDGKFAKIGQLAVAFPGPLPAAIKICLGQGALEQRNDRRFHLDNANVAGCADLDIQTSIVAGKVNMADGYRNPDGVRIALHIAVMAFVIV